MTVSSFQKREKLGFGFTLADELEAVDIGSGDRPRPTYVNKKLDSEFKVQLIGLFKEFFDYFTWDYHEMTGLDRSIVEHKLQIKAGFRLFAQAPRRCNPKILPEIKDKIQRIVGPRRANRGGE